jgi:hypothetical protein
MATIGPLIAMPTSAFHPGPGLLEAQSNRAKILAGERRSF